MFAKEAYVALGSVGTNFLNETSFDFSNTHITTNIRWYVPCSVKHPRWSSIYRILSVELWLFLVISILIAAISTTLVGRYSCTYEWQVYKALTSSFTKVWAVIFGVPVSKMSRTPSLRSLFLAWVCFSVAFNTVFQAHLTTYLVDSGYKTPNQNMDELVASDIQLAYKPFYSIIFENSDETELSKVQRNLLSCPIFKVCLDWARYQNNASILVPDIGAELSYADGELFGENSEMIICKLEDGVVYSSGLRMVMFHGDPLMKSVNEIIDRVVEAGIYNHWISFYMDLLKVNPGR
jgi:hypothetical protein